MLKRAKSLAADLLGACGWELKRSRPKRETIYNDVYEALLQGTNLVQTDIADCTDKLGFSFGRWHPWVETARQISDRKPHQLDYSSSICRRFYGDWSLPILVKVFSGQLDNTRYANHFCKIFHGYFLPFSDAFVGSLEERVAAATKYLETDNRKAGYRLGVEQSINDDGTWTDKKGDIELARLGKLIDSIEQHGFQRSSTRDGDILAYALEKDHTLRYVIVSGLHRAAVLSALGHKTLTLRLYRNLVIGRHTVASWPLVKLGIYSPEDALEYFDHMFDFDSQQWAQTHHLRKGE